MTIFELDQSYEIPLTEYYRGSFGIRYAYARSKDCQENNERGQDFMTWRIEPFRAAFALCDGVGQSFFGGIGAQVVGEALMEWLWALPISGDPIVSDPGALTLSLRNHLNSKKVSATALINEKDLNKIESDITRDALSARREKRGTQSNFVCGLVDIPSQGLPKGRVLLFWLGDAKLQIWNEADNRTNKLKATWDGHEGWSSQFGVKGEIHYFPGTLEELNCVIAHSDGVDPLQSKLSPTIPTSDLGKGLKQLGDDDVSYLELHMIHPPVDMEDDLVSVLRKSPETPVRILNQIQYIKEPPVVIEKRIVPRSYYMLSILAIILTAMAAGLLGYVLGTINKPIQVEPIPIIVPTNTPFTLIEPTIAPTSTEIPTSTITVLPIQEARSGNLGNGEVYLTFRNTVVPSPLQIGCNVLDVGVRTTTISVKGAFQVLAYSTHACEGSPIVIFLNGAVEPLSKNILSVNVEPVSNP